MLLHALLTCIISLPVYALVVPRIDTTVQMARRDGCTFQAGENSLTGTNVHGACRYSVRYANIPQRWGYSTLVTGVKDQNVAAVPPACPQSWDTYTQSTSQSEDCLFATIYTPPTISSDSKLPVFVWIHGGSFVSGSASAPGLDASHLATNGDMVVVVLQYRLGILGFIPPTLSPSTNDPNLGLLDILNGLKGINKYISYFGGDQSKVTVGGQSSGAVMIRTLLGVPSAKGLFRGAILQSDPMSYGLASPDTTGQLREAFFSSGAMADCQDLACYQAIPVSNILCEQANLLSYAPYAFPGIPLAEIVRPTYNTATLPSDPTSALFTHPSSLVYSPPSLPLLITTVQNEGGSATQSIFPLAVPASNDTYYSTLAGLVGQQRANAIVNSKQYTLLPGDDTFRTTFERLITDGIWRCANRDVAKSWADAGGNVWVGEWKKGVVYPTNTGGDYCTQQGRVCHEDDIFPTFGTAPSPSSDMSALENEVNAYWIRFITNLDPNVPLGKRDESCSPDLPAPPHPPSPPDRPEPPHHHPRATSWSKYTSLKTVFALGGDQASSCPEGIWGDKVQYDWQMYG